MLRSRFVATAASCAVLGGVGGAGAVALVGSAPAATRTTTVTTSAAVRAATSAVADTTAESVYRRAAGSVAHVTARVTQRQQTPFGVQEQQGESTGTAFVVSSDGLLVTNAHVVEGATSVQVALSAHSTYAARVVGTDASTDLAVLRVDAGDTALPALRLAPAGEVEIGEEAFAIGTPYGLDRTLTSGVISATGRTIQGTDGADIRGALQTDAALNPGSSGGPLLDDEGRVIGVNSQIATSGTSDGNVGIGFAVPSETVARVVARLAGTSV